MKIPEMRTPYNFDQEDEGKKTALYCKDPSLAQQQFKDTSDINNLVDQFMKTNEMPQLQLPNLGDYEGVFDFQSAMNAVNEATHQFMQLPAKMRARFSNDPQEFHDFVIDPENTDELIKMGLATPLAPPPGEAALLASERAQEASGAAEGPPKGKKAPKTPKTDTED